MLAHASVVASFVLFVLFVVNLRFRASTKPKY